MAGPESLGADPGCAVSGLIVTNPGERFCSLMINCVLYSGIVLVSALAILFAERATHVHTNVLYMYMLFSNGGELAVSAL